MDRDRSSARHLSAELEDPLRPESSQIPEKMLPWCPKFRDLAGWLPQIAPSDLAPSDETQDHEETVLNVGQPWLHIMAQPSCVFPAKTSTQLKWDYRPQSKCKFHRKKRLRWAAFSWRVHNLTMLRNGGTTRICDENPSTFGVIFFNITRNIPINMGQWTCQSILNRHIGVNPSKIKIKWVCPAGIP
jgi:hypothetical protein